MEKYLSKSTYIIYMFLYSYVSYKTDFGFEYTNGYELLWGSIVAALISGWFANILFKLCYYLTGRFSMLLDFNSEERRSVHWKFRFFFSFLVLMFTYTPLCNMIMTLIVHASYTYIANFLTNSWNQYIDTLVDSVSNFGK